MKNLSCQFYSDELPDEKCFRMVLCGLHRMTIQEIKDELKLVKIVPEDVRIIEPKHSRYNEHVKYILFFQKGSITFAAIKEIKIICHTVVRWDHYR